MGCVNTLGSYQCVDLEAQASGDHPSSVESTGTTSSMSVECSSGFKIGTSGSCIDIDECAINNGGCSHTCQNTLGGANCLCPPSFMLGNDWKTCKGAYIFSNFSFCKWSLIACFERMWIERLLKESFREYVWT